MLGRFTTSTLFQPNELIEKIKNTLIWAYEYSPVNFSSVTGIYHPSISRLSGDMLLGRTRYAMENEGLGLSDEFYRMAEVAKNDPRGMCYGSFGPMPFLFVTRPSDIQQIMMTHEDDVDRNKVLEPFTYVFGNKNIFGMPTGKEWEVKRRTLKKWIFTPEALEKLTEPMQGIVDEYIEKMAVNGNMASLEQFVTALAMDLFSRSILKTDSLCEQADTISSAFGNAMKCASNPMSIFLLKIKLIVEYVKVKINIPLDLEKEKLEKIIINLFVTPNIENLKTNDSFLRHYFQESDSEEEAKNNAMEDAASILLAGHETTSRLLQFTIMLLARYPDILAKIRDEITHNKPEHGSWTRKDLEKMVYLHKVLKESLRLFPPVPVVPRMVMNEFVLGDLVKTYKSKSEYHQLMENRNQNNDLVLSKGTVIFVAIWQTHRLEQVYDDPNAFKPERYQSDLISQSHEEERYRCAFIPFGLGNRDCIGRNVAIQEAQLTLISLLDKYDFTIDKELQVSNTYMQGTLRHKGNVHIEFKHREPVCAARVAI